MKCELDLIWSKELLQNEKMNQIKLNSMFLLFFKKKKEIEYPKIKLNWKIWSN